MATVAKGPTGDSNVSGTWSGSAGTRYQAVDDYPDSGGADYLEHGTAAGYLEFTYSAFSIPAGSTGISVQVQYYDAEPGSGNNNCAGRLVVGGTAYNASTHNPSGATYSSRSDNWATNPKSGAAWTVDDVNGVGGNALQRFGFYAGDANPVIRFSSIQLQVTYTPPQNRAQVSFAELEVPTAPRRGRVSFAELETPSVPRRGQVSFGELEVPTAPRRARVSWSELEVPTAPRRGRVSFAELETPSVPRRGQVSFGELEVPTAPRRGMVSFAELEVPNLIGGGFSFPQFQGPVLDS